MLCNAMQNRMINPILSYPGGRKQDQGEGNSARRKETGPVEGNKARERKQGQEERKQIRD